MFKKNKKACQTSFLQMKFLYENFHNNPSVTNIFSGCPGTEWPIFINNTTKS